MNLGNKFPPALTHMYIYIYAVESGIGPSLATFKVRDWAKFVFFFLTGYVKKPIK